MKLRTKLRSLPICLLFLSQIALGSTTTLKDINYNFDQNKVKASTNTFQFIRAFVGYYYSLIAQNSNSLNLANKAGLYDGWCVGDAHAENFGILLQDNGSTVFTMNDMDDSGPCPVVLDLYRLMVTSRLYRSDIDVQEILKAYKDGLKGITPSFPSAIRSLSKDAQKAGFQISAKDLDKNIFKRKKAMNEVDSATKEQITNLLQAEFRVENLRVQDIVATTKVGGGSGGLQRYEVLITNSNKELIHLELKELLPPSIGPVARSPIPDQSSRLKKSLELTQGQAFSHYYNVVNLQGKIMLLRPKFGGNKGISLDDSSQKDNKEIINFEAYILGRIHASTVNVSGYSHALEDMDAKKWEDDITAMVNIFNNRFNELKKY